ncbi:hypothetical protein KAW50_02290 [candidate division WOR-3 bacterium]|nr:hypothetical protein [candidate division WOR-3 bacterium]
MDKKETGRRVYLAKADYISGFCPICSKPVGIVLNENSTELFGVCSECGNTLFYSNKLPVQEIIETTI